MRIIFLGTPEFAIPSLEKLIAWPAAEVVGLVTQPDRPAGRGHSIIQPPTKIVALRHSIPVLQPEKLSKAPDIVQAMRDLKPDVLVTVAFGQILKKEILSLAPFGVVNVHGSLLPKYRGAAPINWALIQGEQRTGITTMFSDPGIDTGEMLLKKEMSLDENMNAEELAHSMSFLGADLLIDTLEKLKSNSLKSTPQDDNQASYAPRLSKELGNINWQLSSEAIHNLVRGLVPWPGAYSHLDSQPLKILKTALCQEKSSLENEPGTVLKTNNQFLVACGKNGQDLLEIMELKPANKSKMTASAWANGHRLKPGIVLKAQ